MRHKWQSDSGLTHTWVCQVCGMTKQQRPHPHARYWYTEFGILQMDGSRRYVDGKTPPCGDTAALVAEQGRAG